MDKLEEITVRPVEIDTCPDECRVIYAQFRELEHYDTEKLMQLAWRAGYQRGYSRGSDDTERSLIALLFARLEERVLRTVRNESLYDGKPRTLPQDHADDIGKDRYNAARIWNRNNG